MDKTYAIFLDPESSGDVLKPMRRFLEGPEVHGWWNHMPGLYLVLWQGDASSLSVGLEKLIRPAPFFVAKVDLEDSQGWLPDRAWAWIQRRQSQTA